MHEPASTEGTTAAPASGLHRSLGLVLLVLYGLGVTIGAGVYVLVGVAAERAGSHAPLAFIIAAAVMGFTAASFAELAGRMPVSAGEAAYVRAGFRSDALGLGTGILVITASIVAAAAITSGSVGYIRTFVAVPAPVLATVVLGVMGAIATAGMLASAWVAAAMTIIEIGGLVVIITAGLVFKPEILGDLAVSAALPKSIAAWDGVFEATLIAFFAFIGFEGLVNIAEETHEPETTLPKAIFFTLAIATLIYILVLIVSLAYVGRHDLATSDAPLALVFHQVTDAPPYIVAAIAIVATLNGIIAQLVLAARVLYGLSGQGHLPLALSRVHGVTRTPILATVLATAAAVLLATTLPIEKLADLTSRIMLVIFLLVNASLVAIKWRSEPAPADAFLAPIWIPVIGAVSCLLLLVASLVG